MPTWPTVSTTRLRMRVAQADDLPAMEKALADPRFPQHLPLARMRRDGKLQSWLQRMTSEPLQPKLWAITTAASDECVGTVALVPGAAPQTWWLSYWLSPFVWSQGFAQEAVRALLASAASQSGYAMVVAAVAQDNVRSIRVLKALGFVEAMSVATAQEIPPEHIVMQLSLADGGDA